MDKSKSFYIDSAIASSDKDSQLIIENNTSRWEQSFTRGIQQFSNLELARKRAGFIKYKATKGLEKYLIEFESNFQKNGGKVIWALDAQEANNHIIDILKKNNALSVVKSKTLILDEIELAAQLVKEGIILVETNPGSFILAQANESPRHFSSMIMHKSLPEITGLLKLNHQEEVNSGALKLHEFIRMHLRPKIESAKASIGGANFIVADTGSICISENEGDASLNSMYPNIQIVVVGIDKVIPTIADMDLFFSLYSTYSTGERMSTFNSVVSGPRQEGESDGPNEMYVVLVDNGRSEVLSHKFQRRALSCIDCGACLNVCPVYKTIGGKCYGATYTGPIGSIITPLLNNFNENIHLSYASTLCGKCTDVCPVSINLHEQLMNNRNDAVVYKTHSMSEGLLMDGWHRVMKSRKPMDWLSSKWKNTILQKVYGVKFTNKRKLPEVSQLNFKQLWENRREVKDQ